MNRDKLLAILSALPLTCDLVSVLERAPSKSNLRIPSGSLRSLLYAVIFQKLKRPLLLVTSSLAEAQGLAEEIKFWLPEEKRILLFPSLNVLPFEGLEPSIEVVGARLAVLRQMQQQENFLVVAPFKALLFRTFSAEALSKAAQVLALKQKIERERLFKEWVEMGYCRREIVGEWGEFAVRGGVVDIFPSHADAPLRIEFSGEEIESLRSFDPQSQRSFKPLERAEVLPCKEESSAGFFEQLPLATRVVLEEPIKLARVADRLGEEAKELAGGQAFPGFDFDQIQRELSSFGVMVTSEFSAFENQLELPAEKPKEFHKDLEAFEEEVRRFLALGYQVAVVSKHLATLGEFLPSGALAFNGNLGGGFVLDWQKVALFSDREIFGTEPVYRPKTPSLREGVNRELLLELKVGDYVVHENYGIGIYQGLQTMEAAGSKAEYLFIEYAEGDKLYVPLHHMGLVQKFSSGEEGYQPKISRLGGTEWQKTKAAVKAAIRDFTRDILKLYALREKEKGFAFPGDDACQFELEETFPYEETLDQSKAIAAVKKDMESSRPMDRLICGDVGYGKTEVAIRAAAKAAGSGKQVAVLVPTTILAQQHFNTFKNRLAAFPFRVEMLSRFLSSAEQKGIVESLGRGAVDIVIGTHRLLQKGVSFKDLGLVVLDEEQKFGVMQKEKLKRLKHNVDVLTLTATPIPRTLYFSLSGIRDMSLINTPPVDRLPIRTYVAVWNETLIKEAILKEIERGGQVYFLHPYVESIGKLALNLEKLLPEVKFGIAHGQLPEKELEAAMIDFLGQKFEVLVCTSIIESGLDLSNVNTIIVDQADRFGLSQLYQLRGRVGRSSLRAYAYLLYHSGGALTEAAVERLKTLQEYTALGSGYQIALKDLEIRGAGNLLGPEQSGHMAAVGFDLYTELLEEAVREVRGVKEHSAREISIDLKLDAYIPADYIADEKQRIATYRRMNLLAEQAEVADLLQELEDRFGPIPGPLLRLFQVLGLKVKARKSNVKSIEGDKTKVRMEWWDQKVNFFKPDPGAENWLSEIEKKL